MTLSIICPTFNEEKYIAQTLDSFLRQKYHSFKLEILICDGRSTDDTRAIVEEYSNRYPFIRLIDNPERKTPFAFNAGIKHAKGDYVAILGAHAKYNEDYLQVCYDELIKSGAAGCSGRIITQSSSGRYEPKLSEWVTLSVYGVSANSSRTIREGFAHSVPYPVFKKQVLVDLGGYDNTLERNQDNDMNQRILDAGHKLYSTWKTLCYYRPPANLKALMKYAAKNGFWNAKSILIHAKSMRLHHFIPFFFTTGLLLLALVGAIELIANHTSYGWRLLGMIISLHLLIGLAFTIRSLKYENDGRKVVLPFIFFGFHFSYGWGTIKGFLKGKKA
jgi:glycosyltransferase involved in cell wall biosynthesis